MEENSYSNLENRLCDIALDLGLIATIWMALAIHAHVTQERNSLLCLFIPEYSIYISPPRNFGFQFKSEEDLIWSRLAMFDGR